MSKKIDEKLREIRERARQRGRILLRCPRCRHYLVGIISPRGDFECKTGEPANLYCSWPDCVAYGARVKVKDTVLDDAPRDGTKCCNKIGRSKRKSGGCKFEQL